MNDMTTCCARPVRPVRRIIPKPMPLLLRPEWRTDAQTPASDMQAEAQAGRIRALAAKAQRRAEAFQPPDTVLLNPDFAARVAAIQARRGVPQVCARPVAATMPLAAG